MLLANYPECRSGDADEIESLLIANAGGTHFDVDRERANFVFHVNMVRLNDVALLWSTCNTAIHIDHGPVSYLRHVFPIEKSSRIEIDGRPATSGSHLSGSLVPNGRSWRIDNEADFQNLSLRIEAGALKRKLWAMTGIEPAGDLEFQPSDNDSRTLLLRDAVFRFAHDIQAMGPHLPARSMLELEQVLVVGYLLCNRHNYSQLLQLQPAAPSLAQVRRVEDFIAANWNKPLDIEVLAAVADVSVRSLFRSFRNLLDCSPQAFVKKIRLKQARTLLRRGGDSTSVMAIALQCGFHSLGHFARSYRDLFGELPSDTLHHSRPSIHIEPSEQINGSSPKTA